VIDCEVDGLAGEESLRKSLCGDPLTLGWNSRRGPHYLFRWDDRLSKYGKCIIKVPELPGLEIRIGGDGKQLQSCCPPTTGDDGQPRKWNDCDTIAELPESVYVYLDEYVLRPLHQPRGSAFRAVARDGARHGAYAATALVNECQAVATATEGTRNDTLNRAAHAVGTLVGAGALDEQTACLNLQAAARQCGLPEEEARKTIASGLSAGKAEPRDLSRLAARCPVTSSRNGPPAGTADPASLASLTDADLGLTFATSIQVMPVRWLWLYRLAFGAMALLAGDGGIGKSLVLLWIAARVSRGDPWGDGSGNAPVGDVIILSAEDRTEDTILPRLMAMGADLSRITIMRARVVIRQEGKEAIVSPMTFQDRSYWREVFGRRPGCRLFVVDPLASYLGKGVSDARNNEVRGVLEPFLAEIIEPRGVCMLCNSHLNKSIDARSPIHRIMGSIAFAALPRNVHIVVRDPENDARRIFAQAKCNNAPDDLPALAYAVERSEVVAPDGEVIETAVPIFEPEPVKIRLADLMAPKRDRETNRGEIERATQWLHTRLTNGPVGSILCAREGDQFLGRRWPDPRLPTVERRKQVLGRTKWWRETILKSRLGGESKRAGYNGPYLFRLPTQEWPPDPAAAVEAKRIDKEEMASTDSTEESAWIIPVEAVEAGQSCSDGEASTEFEEGDI
jgi:hypothetical protein